MQTEGGRWTVIQRRMDGTVNFYRPWDQYKFGFGDAAGEYWLGLDYINYLTKKQKYELLVEMEDFQGNKKFARYSLFSVGPECDGFKLTVSGFTNSPKRGRRLPASSQRREVLHLRQRPGQEQKEELCQILQWGFLVQELSPYKPQRDVSLGG